MTPPNPTPTSPPPSLSAGLLVAIALQRMFWRAVDFAFLLPRPALRRLWWQGLSQPPSPYAGGFPLRLASRHHQVPADDLVYGEAFVVPTRRLFQRLGLGPGQVVVDLGCGRGAVLVASSSLGLVSRGTDLLPAHVAAIASAAAAADIVVGTGDARVVDEGALADVDCVWLSWVTWSDATRAAVTARLRHLKAGALVCGVVHGIDDDGFEPVLTTTMPFSWGPAEVVVRRRRATS